MCLAIPGKIVELRRPNMPHLGRRGGDRRAPAGRSGCSQDEHARARRLGADPRRLRDEQDQRGAGGRADADAARCSARTRPRWRRCAATASSRAGAAMRFVDEFRDPELITRTCEEIRRLADPGRHYRIMEVCGGHTHAIYRFGLKDVLPAEHRADPRARLSGVRAADGPDRRRPGARPRPAGDLHRLRRHDARARHARQPARAQGAAAWTSGSCTRRSTRSSWPAANPDRHVMFFAIGFETTAPSTALTLMRAKARGHPQLLRVLQPRHDHPGDPRDPRLARHADRRVHRPGPRLDGDRLPALRVDRARRAEADRRLRLRAARPAAVHRHAAAPARGRASEGGEPVRAASCRGRATAPRSRPWPRCSSCGPTSSGAASASSPSRRCGSATSTPRWDAERVFEVPGVRVTDPKAAQCGEVLKGVLKPAPVQAVRQGVHARAPGRRVDGVVGRLMRSVLQLRASEGRGADERWLTPA